MPPNPGNARREAEIDSVHWKSTMKIFSLLSAVLLLAACITTAQTVPSGTEIVVRLIDGIDSTKTGAGERFRASIDDPVILGDRVVIPRNADATVQVVKADKTSELSIKLYDVTVNGRSFDVVSNYAQVKAPAKGKVCQTLSRFGSLRGSGRRNSRRRQRRCDWRCFRCRAGCGDGSSERFQGSTANGNAPQL